ncbi:hypothetical protein [Massilia sp. BSC265]|uniref:hypothetical protein n=1 Tax=Massilia sp. BSC265 TaxID=1549812 RepID=UPI00056053B0|nr:hypothetical protein [Massilia sp. BSC265]
MHSFEQGATTVSRQAQAHPDAVTFQQLLMLEGIARRLARKYPPDWLERQGRPLYLLTLALSFLSAALLGLAWGPWWGFLIPLFMPTLVLVALPRLLFGRVTGRPRWAHPLATLDRQDAELVRRMVASMRSCSSISGERFFEIWRRARQLAAYRHHG